MCTLTLPPLHRRRRHARRRPRRVPESQLQTGVSRSPSIRLSARLITSSSLLLCNLLGKTVGISILRVRTGMKPKLETLSGRVGSLAGIFSSVRVTRRPRGPHDDRYINLASKIHKTSGGYQSCLDAIDDSLKNFGFGRRSFSDLCSLKTKPGQ